jgi:hypothetical protein
MKRTEKYYYNTEKLSVFITTWNVNAKLPQNKNFHGKSNLFELDENEPPDIVVFGL